MAENKSPSRSRHTERVPSAGQATGREPDETQSAVEPYEPPKLVKFERLSKLIVSGE